MKREITLADILKKIEECKQAQKQMKQRHKQYYIDKYYESKGDYEKMSDFKYEINEQIETLSDNKGYTKEINIITFNDQYKLLDIRKWNRNNNTMQKGISLTREEAEKLKDTLNKLDFDKI